ncbi:MAG: hypothetical protein CM15mP49_21150 [Actinomycetota bacterium]|nr:MAG: hypothetical protein CM15mP49_21150 [Actinomycetota bacterium]
MPCNVIELMCEATQKLPRMLVMTHILSVVDQIIVPQGTWTINNPGGLVAQHLGIAAKASHIT